MWLLLVNQPSAACKILLPILAFILFFCIISTTEAGRKLNENGTFPGLIAFGDSILDTGNNNKLRTLTKCNYPPYGEDFIGGQASGRFGNGKVLSDLIAEGLGIKEVVPAYLDPNLQSKDLATGVCFASGGSGLDPTTAALQSVISISEQLNNFKEYLGKLKGVVGEASANTTMSNTLFLMSSGNNDIAITYFSARLRPRYDPSTYTSLLVNLTSTFIKDLYGLGVRKVAVFGTLPLGCLPSARTISGGLLRVCSDIINQVAESFNSKLSTEINNLKSTLPEAQIVYIDVYSPLLDLIQNPEKSGFQVADQPCCGTGTSLFCTPFLVACPNSSQFVFWDSAHPSESAYRIMAPQILQNLKSSFS